jgi:hypothetical protein
VYADEKRLLKGNISISMDELTLEEERLLVCQM